MREWARAGEKGTRTGKEGERTGKKRKDLESRGNEWKGGGKNCGEGAGTEKGKTENRKRANGKKWCPQSTCS